MRHYKAVRKNGRGDDDVLVVPATQGARHKGQFQPNDARIAEGHEQARKAKARRDYGAKGTTPASQLRQLAEEQKRAVYKRPTDLPLVFLFRVYNNILKDHKTNEDIDAPLNIRVEAAKAALPYLHKRLPIEVISTDTPAHTITAEALEALTDKELQLLEGILRKLPAPAQGQDTRPAEQQLLARVFEHQREY